MTSPGAELRGLRLESEVTPDARALVALTVAGVRNPGPDEVVVRVDAAPINPSDLSLMFAFGDIGRAEFGGSPDRPVVSVPIPAEQFRGTRARLNKPMALGNEGAGTVVQAGGSSSAQALLGRLVSVAGGGMYSQFRRVPASACLALPEGTAAAHAAASFINPMTALGILETMKSEGHSALVHTAAASSLGQLLNRLCLQDQVPLVNIVRSPDQAQMLRRAGADVVCDSSAADFDAALTEALKETGATIAFDAVGGGSLVDRILACMEAAISEDGPYQVYGSDVVKQVYVYGSLDRSTTSLSRTYGMSWSVGGWLLPRFLRQIHPELVASMRRRVADGLNTTFAARFTDSVTLAGALMPHAIAAYGRPSTGTKFLITPHG
jgi:NADPH2:quinone reductase